ncbi:hypothetical protein [Nocardia huaxiensis]|uniref:YggT family protein n=1 Tax=Nocardia huaxiensis TaxID=2755382 RepID=A0A7D6V8S7_9NOCA|nr:hypothetical protein [Nocardia huaxiensis]QLY29131.1 hypothetical protein H0264_28075 [Nocardia huaxiensis]UFS97376.1 hypothetical protein LPY97_05525 [Nocardia huaxiensis]
MPYVARNEATAARIIAGVGAVFALIEGLYILMLVLDADQTNRFFLFIKQFAEPLALFFPGLFHTGNADLDIVLNYGLAALFWLIVSGFVARWVAK